MLLKTVLNGIYFSGIQSICAPMLRGAGSILMLHHVRDLPDTGFLPNSNLSVSPDFLDVTIMRLKQEGYQFVSLDEMEKLLKSGQVNAFSKPVLALTLDDGRGTATSLSFRTTDASGNAYVFTLPNVKFTSGAVVAGVIGNRKFDFCTTTMDDV